MLIVLFHALTAVSFATADWHVAAYASAAELLAQTDPQPKGGPVAPPSDVEKITKLQRTIEADEKQVEEITSKLADPEGEYAVAEREFKKLDEMKIAEQKMLDALKADKKLAQAMKKELELAKLDKLWSTAKTRFELALVDRKTLQAKLANLKQKIAQDKLELEKLAGPAMKEKVPDPKVKEENGKTVEPAKKEAEPAPKTETPAVKETQPPNGKNGESKDVTDAREEAQRKEAAAREAKAKAQTLAERVESLRIDIAADQQLLETAVKKRDLEEKAWTDLDAELQRMQNGKATAEQVQQQREKIRETYLRFAAAATEIRRLEKSLQERREQLAGLEAERNAAQQVAKIREEEAAAADRKVQELVNPYTTRNITQWLIDHGPRLLAILIIMWLLYRLVRLGSRRVVNVVVGKTQRKSRKQLEDRVDTLNGVFRNTASLLILCGGTLMFLQELGIPIVPLMGGAAVFGLAVAFGAQNLVKDYFAGFMILMEDQYAVRDVVKIGDVAGLVERISLRVTMLRDLEGNAHFIPNGSITQVTNLTHTWSRSLFDIPVSYREDVDRVMDVLMNLCRDMRQDPKFGLWILEDPEMLGVDAMTDSAIMIKFFVKTQPLKQWEVKRELLRRIKKRFDEIGIEIPFPQRVVHHRYDQGQSAAA